MLVNAANVDPFLEGRAASHLWSHQMKLECPLDQSCLGKKGREQLVEALQNPQGAFVMWVRAGHEIKQERKRVLMDLMDVLCFPQGEGVRELEPEYLEALTSAESGKFLPSQEFISRIQVKATDGNNEAEEEKQPPPSSSSPSPSSPSKKEVTATTSSSSSASRLVTTKAGLEPYGPPNAQRAAYGIPSNETGAVGETDRYPGQLQLVWRIEGHGGLQKSAARGRLREGLDHQPVRIESPDQFRLLHTTLVCDR